MAVIPFNVVGSCSRCRFYAFREAKTYKDAPQTKIPDSEISKCCRYPKHVKVSSLSWCGEFEEKA